MKNSKDWQELDKQRQALGCADMFIMENILKETDSFWMMTYEPIKINLNTFLEFFLFFQGGADINKIKN